MAHSVSEAAARAVKNSERKQAETRTPEQRLADIRKNRAAKLFVTPDDQDFLLAQHDAYKASAESYKESVEKSADDIMQLRAQLAGANDRLSEYANVIVPGLEAKLEEFRQVYEEENRTMAVKMERTLSESATDGASNY